MAHSCHYKQVSAGFNGQTAPLIIEHREESLGLGRKIRFRRGRGWSISDADWRGRTGGGWCWSAWYSIDFTVTDDAESSLISDISHLMD